LIHWLQSLLADYGYWVIGLVVFFNNLGLPVPGDTILLAAGFFSAKGNLSVWAAWFSGTIGCFMGANGGYWIGTRFGHPLLRKISWIKMTPEKINRIEKFFEKYGAKAVFFARFIALLHPVTGLLAGTGKTPLRPFLFYNLMGSAAYVCLYVLGGYYFGERWGLVRVWIGDAVLYLILILAILIAAFLGLLLWRFLRDQYLARVEKSSRKTK
jgi:membrane protein DedA with SNARE-associated domain